MSRARLSAAIVEGLSNAGVRLVAGVPDGAFSPAIADIAAREDMIYAPCAREEECIGVAAGALFGDARAAALSQNAGLLNALGAFATLGVRYRLPLPVIVANRGSLTDHKPYDIEKFECFDAVDPKYIRRFDVHASAIDAKHVENLVSWCAAASRPAVLAVAYER